MRLVGLVSCSGCETTACNPHASVEALKHSKKEWETYKQTYKRTYKQTYSVVV